MALVLSHASDPLALSLAGISKILKVLLSFFVAHLRRCNHLVSTKPTDDEVVEYNSKASHSHKREGAAIPKVTEITKS